MTKKEKLKKSLQTRVVAIIIAFLISLILIMLFLSGLDSCNWNEWFFVVIFCWVSFLISIPFYFWLLFALCISVLFVAIFDSDE